MYILLVLALICFWFCYRKICSVRSRKHFPPGPLAFPIIGNLWQLRGESYLALQRLAETYGPIMSATFGVTSVVVLSDHKMIREAFSKDSLSGRPHAHPSSLGTGGILFSEGRLWKEQKEFAIKTIKDISRTCLETYAKVEIEELLQKIDRTEGPILANNIYLLGTLNVLWQLVGGMRFSEHDPAVTTLFEKQALAPRRPSFAKSVVFSLAWLKPYLPKQFLKDVSANRDQIERIEELATRTVDFQSTLQANGTATPNFVSACRSKIMKTKDPQSSFYTNNQGENNMLKTLVDLFRTGTETTIFTTAWALLLLANDQTAQEQIRKEILRVIGRHRFPSLSDRKMMPVTDATIKEILRYTSLSPLGIPKRATTDTWLGGYLIPKDTIVLANLYAANHDKKAWSEPEKFSPGRFLSQDETEVVGNEAFLAFGTGLRICPFDWLGKQQIFLVLTSLLQKFRVCPYPPSTKIPFVSMDGSNMLAPKPFHVTFVKLSD